MPRIINVALPTRGLPGQYLPLYDGNMTTGALSLNVGYYIPFDVVRLTNIDQLVAEVTTIGGAGAVIRAGLYNDDGSGQHPGTLLVDGGTVESDATTGLKVFPAVLSLQPGRYWGVVAEQVATSTVRVTVSTPVRTALLSTTTILSTIGKGASGVSGALPNPATAATVALVNMPSMVLRVA